VPRAQVRDKRAYVQDLPYAYVLTDEGTGSAPHRHCVAVDGTGRGLTSPGPDGHVHQVDELDLTAAAGHTHELSADRCSARHTGRSCLGR